MADDIDIELELAKGRAAARKRAEAQAAPAVEIPEATGWRTETDVPGLDPKSPLGAVQRGATQGVTLGFGDELRGGLAALGRKLGLSDAGYTEERNASRAEDAAADEAHPYLYGGAEFAGSLAAPIPGMAAKPLTFGKYALTKTGQRSLVGTGTGVAMGLGYGTADFADDSPEAQKRGGGLAGDVLPPAALGAVLGPLGGAAGDRLSIWLKKKAQDNALKAIGLRAGISRPLKQRGYETVDEGRELAQAALDMDLVPFGGTAETVSKRAAEAKPRYGAMIEDSLAQADAAEKLTPLAGNSNLVEPLGFDYARAAQQAQASAQGPKGLTAAALDASGPAAKNLDQIRRQAALDSSFKAANQLKSDMYQGINYALDPELSTKLQRKTASGLRQSIEEQVAEAAGTEAADQLTTANTRWGQLADISDLASDEAMRHAGRKTLTDMTVALALGAGSAGHAAGGATGGLLGAGLPLAAKVLGPRMPSAFARTQQALAPQVPGMAAGIVRGIQNRTADRRRENMSPADEVATSAFLSGG